MFGCFKWGQAKLHVTMMVHLKHHPSQFCNAPWVSRLPSEKKGKMLGRDV